MNAWMAVTIPYAPPAPVPWYRSRRTQKLTLALAIAAALSFALAFGYRSFQQLAYLWRQRELLRYTLPANTCVWGPNQVGHTIAADLRADCLPSTADVFVHELRAPGRAGRLVWVCVDSTRTGDYLRWQVYKEAGLSLGSRMSTLGDGSASVLFEKIYSGQPDPSDPSHFTAHCERGGVSYAIDGWLLPDDTVQMQMRR
jgi:hypothetical protein